VSITTTGPLVSVPKSHRRRSSGGGCTEECAGLHPPFNPYAPDQDRCYTTLDDAMHSAMRRAEGGRGRQRVSRHFGRFFKRGIWFVQDVR
jgi:hypothetical protein